MSFRYLDMEHYERIEHFRYFLSMPYPYAGVTVDIDRILLQDARVFVLSHVSARRGEGRRPRAGAAAAHP